jgi:3-hydroxybutyryl-CoA dehydrogenase
MDVAVLGAGRMGHGIAQVASMARHDVVLRDIDDDLVQDGLASIQENLEKGVELGKVEPETRDSTLTHLDGTTSLETAVQDADFVIEAVPEDMDLKKQVFSEVDEYVPSQAILATNTSSLSVTEIASSVSNSSRFIGLHFFNPPHLMDLVEIVLAEQTSEEVEQRVVKTVEDFEKTSVVIEDFPGFATSRLGVTLGVEAMRMVQSGVGAPADIDRAMREGYGHPMGPLELTDQVGLDVRLDILEHLRKELGERFRPPAILRRKVRAGKLGKKTGKGFYTWNDGQPVERSDEKNE